MSGRRDPAFTSRGATASPRKSAVTRGMFAARRGVMRSGVAFALLLVGCFYDEASPLPADFGTCVPVPATAGVVPPPWYPDVEPIITAKCQGCHGGGGIAPFTLADFHDVTSNHEAIQA